MTFKPKSIASILSCITQHKCHGGKVSTADDDAVKRRGNLGQPIVSRQPRPLGRVEAVKISMTLIKRRIQNARSIVGGVLWTTHLEKTFPGRDPGLTEVELVVDD